MELKTPRLKIREFRLDDVDAVYEMDSDPQVRRYEGAPLTEADVRYRLEGAVEWAAETPRSIYKLAITLPPDNRAAGRLSLKVVDRAARSWEIGWTLHPRYWGKGYASEAAQALLEYAFITLNAHRVAATCLAENTASVRLVERLGLRPEGRLRHTVWLNDGWHDELVYGILEDEYGVSKR